MSEGYEVPTELPGSTGWTVLFLSRIQDVVIDCCTSGENWKQVIGFFIEYSTVARLEEQTEHYMPAL